MLKDKTVVIGVSGGIAVYKTLDVISRLRKLGVNVIETAVGFKHVGEAMRKNKVIIGGNSIWG